MQVVGPMNTAITVYNLGTNDHLRYHLPKRLATTRAMERNAMSLPLLIQN